MDILVENIRQQWPSKGGGSFVALDGVSHHFRSGRFSCILGPSGCGKSTLAQIIGGLAPASSGSVTLTSPEGKAGSARAACVMVWQNQNLFPWRTVEDNVAFGPEMAGAGREHRLSEARRLLGKVGLQGFGHHYPKQLSGGMRQRVALARALIMDRPVMLMDEPFGALDAQTKLVMQEELIRIFEENRKTIVFVTHAIDEAILLGDEVVVMTARPGRIKEVLPVDLPRPRSLDMVNSPVFSALYRRAFELIREEVTRAMEQQNASLAAAS
jgi:NitT/TauT family transport system ATP-binding protein